MECSLCGGNVILIGPLENLTQTQCCTCGNKNCQIVDEPDQIGRCGCCGEETDMFVETNGQKLWLCAESMQEHERNWQETAAMNSDC